MINKAQQLALSILGYMVLKADDTGKVSVECMELAEAFGVKKYQVEYAFNMLLTDKFRSSFAGLSQFLRTITVYDTEGFGYSFAELSQRFRSVFAELGVSTAVGLENLKKTNNDSLENNNFQGKDEEKSCNDDNSISNISNSIYNNISIRDNTLIGDNKRGVGEKEEPTTKVDYKRIVEIFNVNCPTLPKVQVLSDKRKQGVRQRVIELTKAYPNHDYLQIITRLCQKVNESDFLSGRGGQWKASFDWLFCCKGNYLKVIEGNYDNNNSQQPIDKDTERQMVLAQRQRESTAKAIADQEARSKLTKEEIWRAGKEAQEKHKEQIARNRAQIRAQNQQEYEELMKQYNEGKITL